MNVVLVSPADALVFDYLAFGIFTLVNNLWTWVAVVTAAISFWHFRTDKSKPVCVDRVDDNNDPVEKTTFECSGLGTENVSTSGSTTLEPNGQVQGFEDNSVTKGKFAAYYYEESVETVNERDNGEETALDGIKWWPERLLMRMKMEDGGWYSYQDLTVVNGNVVRLWEGSIRKGRWEYSSGCVMW